MPVDATTDVVGSESAPQRSVLLDLMRAQALVVVVVLHVTGIDALSLFASMAIIFFVAGSLFASSLRRRRALAVIIDRYRRVLVPVACYVTVVLIVLAVNGMLTTDVASQVDPAGNVTRAGIYDIARLYLPILNPAAVRGPGTPGGADDEVFWLTNALWYVHTYLVLSLLGPLLHHVYSRWFRATVVIGGLIWLADVVATSGTANTNSFMAFFMAGFALEDGRLGRLSQRFLRRAAVVLGLIGLVLIPLGGTLFINSWVPSMVAIGGAWIACFLGFREQFEAIGSAPRIGLVIDVVNRRAMTIYLWSLLGVFCSRLLMPPDGDPLHLAAVALGSLALSGAVTLAACVAVGWVEDLAARVPPELWPRRRRPAVGTG